MKDLLAKLDGKKTYIGIIVGGIYSILIQLNVVPNNNYVWTAIATWTGVSARQAIK